MKRRLYLLVITLVVLLAPEFVLAQERGRRVSGNRLQNSSTRQINRSVERSQTDSIDFYTLDRNKEFAHWSIVVGLGGSIYDGDIYESAKRVVPTARLDWGVSGAIERSFDPIWGLGLRYSAIPYIADPKDSPYRLKGFSNEMDVYLSVNMLNLFYRNRPQKWGLFVGIGMGMSFYNAKTTNKSTGEVVIDPSGNPMDLKGGVSWVWPLTGQIEYNINKHFAVGLKAEYRFHDKDNFEGQTVNIKQGNWNDAFEVFSLTLRYKPHFGKKHHVRNYSYGGPDIASLERRLAYLEAQIKRMPEKDSCCAANTGRIIILEEKLAKKPDTVKIVEAPKPVPVRTIDDAGIRRILREALRGIQFETAKANIKPVSYPILDNVVLVMHENPKYMLEIVGHTDNVGSAASNLDLSRRRALSVRDYLIRNGVQEYRLSYEGKGLTQPVATNNTAEGRALNRRVEFIVSQDGKVILKSE